MLRRDDRNRLLGDVNAEADQLFIDVGKMLTDELGLAMRDVEEDEVERALLETVLGLQ